jgi:hypothetical protein
MIRFLFAAIIVTASAWSYATEEEVSVQEPTSPAATEEVDSELQNMNLQEEYQEKQKSILDILFGKASEGEVDDTIPTADSLAPGEVEINESNKDGDFSNTAQIKLIDKTLGKLYRFDIPVGKSKQFNEIVVRVLSCWTPNYKTLLPESRALLEIHEVNNEKPKRIFHGWMFSNAPSANMLEHPNFDVTLSDCKNIKG